MYEKTYKQIQKEAKMVEGQVCKNSDHNHTMATSPYCLEQGSIERSKAR